MKKGKNIEILEPGFGIVSFLGRALPWTSTATPRRRASGTRPSRRPRSSAGPAAAGPRPELKGSIGEGTNRSNFSDQSSVNIVSELRKFCV